MVQLSSGQVEQLRTSRTKTTEQAIFLARGRPENKATALIFRQKHSFCIRKWAKCLTVMGKFLILTLFLADFIVKFSGSYVSKLGNGLSA